MNRTITIVEIRLSIVRLMQVHGLDPARTPYAVGSGSGLFVLGLRTSVRDIDVFIPALDRRGIHRIDQPPGVFGQFEMDAWAEWRDRHLENHIMDNRVDVRGVCTMSPRSSLHFKQVLDRPKDQADIDNLKLIVGRPLNEFLKR
jgi:hypothetical protein